MGCLRPAAHDHAQRQLATYPTPGWLLARGLAVVVGGYLTYAVIHPYPSGYLAPTLILTAGATCYHLHTRAERMRTVLNKLGPTEGASTEMSSDQPGGTPPSPSSDPRVKILRSRLTAVSTQP